MGEAKRRLAAIMAADVAGYSRLMGDDERATLDTLNAYRDVFREHIGKHDGRVVDTAGDSVLATFDSVVEAIESACDVQADLAARNAELPENRRMRFRVGVNLGDIIAQDDGTIYGDGVNVAARLEALADPGAICISESARMQADGKLDLAFEDIGEHAVKNIARPVRAFRVVVDARAVSEEPAVAIPLPDKPSIAVLPFANMSGDPEQEYFTDGMTEDIITDLSKVSGLFVIARNSSFTYKGQGADIRRVCRELGVRHVLEGSVRRAGDRVRITAQLINGNDGAHMWAERYDRNLEDIFAVQDEVTREIVAALRVELTSAERDRREGRGKVNPEAYDYLYRARDCLYRSSPDAVADGCRMLQRAIEIDPGIAPAYALLALFLNTNYLNRWNDWHDGTLEEALGLAQRACDIDGDDAGGFVAVSYCQMWRGQLDAAETAARRSLELDSNSAGGCSALGQVLDFRGQHDKAVALFERAFRSDPHFNMALNLLGRAQFALGRDEEAEASFKRRLIRNPKSDTTRAYLAALYGATGRIDEARRVWRALLEINPDFDPQRMRATMPYAVPTWFDRFYGGLEKAGLLS